MIDIKTPKAYNPMWRPQLAAYKHLAEINGYKASRVMSLRFGVQKPIVNESTGTCQYDLTGFLSALNACKYFQSLKERA